MIDKVFAAEAAHTTTDAHTEDVAHTAPDGSPLGTFGINGTMFIGQLINFAIVLIVLYKWAYKPLVKVMEERTSKIENSLKKAEQIEQDRIAADEKVEEQLAKAREEGRAVIAEAQEKALALAEKSKEKTKEEVEAVVTQAKAQIAADREQMMAELKVEAGKLVADAAEKVLGQKMDSKADEKLIASAVEESAK